MVDSMKWNLFSKSGEYGLHLSGKSSRNELDYENPHDLAEDGLSPEVEAHPLK